MTHIKAEAEAKGYVNMRLNSWNEYDCAAVGIEGYRPETEIEKKDRLERLSRSAKGHEEKERQEFLRLKAKFEGKP